MLAMADGVWLYDPKAHALLPHLKDDIRAQTGLQDFVATAPLNLVYVAHGERMTDVSRRGAPALCLGRYRLHRPERLSLLRLGGARHGVSRRGRLSQAGARLAAPRSAVRDLRADRRLPPRVTSPRYGVEPLDEKNLPRRHGGHGEAKNGALRVPKTVSSPCPPCLRGEPLRPNAIAPTVAGSGGDGSVFAGHALRPKRRRHDPDPIGAGGEIDDA